MYSSVKNVWIKDLDYNMKSIKVKQINRVVENPLEIQRFVRELDPRNRDWTVVAEDRRLYLNKGLGSRYGEEQYWLYSDGYLVAFYDEYTMKLISLQEDEYKTLFSEIQIDNKSKKNREVENSSKGYVSKDSIDIEEFLIEVILKETLSQNKKILNILSKIKK